MRLTSLYLIKIVVPMRIYKYALSILLLSVALAACSPSHNWREITNQEAGYTATFPGRAAVVTRSVNILNLDVPLSMQAVAVEGLYYAVGYIPLQGGLSGKGPELIDALALAMAHNINSDSSALTNATFAGVSARYLDISGVSTKGQKLKARAYFFEHADRVYEVFLIGGEDQFNPDIVSQWFSGFSLSGVPHG